MHISTQLDLDVLALEGADQLSLLVELNAPTADPAYPAPLDAADHQDLVGKPFAEAYQALLDRGGDDFGMEVDSTGADGSSYHFTGVRMDFDGAERVRAVVPSGER